MRAPSFFLVLGSPLWAQSENTSMAQRSLRKETRPRLSPQRQIPKDRDLLSPPLCMRYAVPEGTGRHLEPPKRRRSEPITSERRAKMKQRRILFSVMLGVAVIAVLGVMAQTSSAGTGTYQYKWRMNQTHP